MKLLFIIPIIFFVITAIGNIIIAQAIFTTSEGDQKCIIPVIATDAQVQVVQSLYDALFNNPKQKTPIEQAQLDSYTSYINSAKTKSNDSINDAARYEYAKCRKFFFTDAVTSGISTGTSVLNVMRISMVFSLISTFIIIIGSIIGIFF